MEYTGDVTQVDEDTTRKRPSGRRSGDSGTRDAILDAAKELFAELGYDGASLRAIASAAGVDPALIRHFFGDKETLFATTVADRTTIPQRMATAFEGDPAGLGARITDGYLRMWEEPGTRAILHALVRSATTSEHAATMLLDILGARLRDQSPATDDERMQRIAIAASHLLGVAMARYIVKVPPITAMSHDDLVAHIAPTIQAYLTGTTVTAADQQS